MEWPEGTVDDASSGQPVPVVNVPMPETAPASETIVATAAPEPVQPVVADGIIWNIQTNRP